MSRGRDRGSKCAVFVASDGQSVIYQSRLRGPSVASKHVGLTGQCLQEVVVDEKLALEKVHTAVGPADVCTQITARRSDSRAGAPCLRNPVLQ